MLFGLVVGLLTARYLGPSNYGLITYAGAYTGFFSAVCTLGINNVLVKEFINRPGDEGTVIGTALGLRALSSVLSAVAIVCVSFVLDAGQPMTILVVALSSLGMVFHISDTFNYWFQSRLESRVTALAALAAYLVSSAYKIYLLAAGKDVLYFALVSSLDYLCLGVILFWQYKRHRGGRLRFCTAYAKRLFSESRHFILSGMMIAVYGQTDRLMLKHMIGEAETGYYATAVTVCGIWCFVLSAIIDSVYPSIMKAAQSGDEALFRRRNVQLYAVVFYLSMAVSLVLSLLAPFIIRVMFGEAYLPSAAPLRVVTWYTAFSYLGVARNAWIVAKTRQKHLFQIYVAAAVSNVVLNLIFIPLWGASGAAAASLAAQIVTTFVAPLFIRDTKENTLLMLEAVALKGILW
ncbi:MAG: flippase, partial [Clostridia bacterium]|nr:flippase [Clostridia bacterium]